MPFEVRKDNDKFCVFNSETDENKGCSDSRDQAVAHLKALYANEAEMAVEEVLSFLDEDEKEAFLAGDNFIFSDGMKEYPWEGPIVFENVVTGDNRIFKSDSINWQEDTLPWAFRWQKASGQGHAGSVPVGRVDRIERMEDGSIHGYGVVIPDLSDEATQYLKLLESGVGGGVSVDGDSAQFDVQEQEKGQPRVEFSSMRLRALSAVDIPAFNGARIHLIDAKSETTEFVDEASEELLETIDLDEVADKKSLAFEKKEEEDSEDEGENSPQDNFKAMIAAKKAKAKKKVEASHGWNIDEALVAAAIPTLPSTEAFVDPEFDGPTPLTVTPDGRVFGHLALFNTCHIGFPGTCVKPPKGSKYQYFHTGQIETAEGDIVDVGRLTFKTGHAEMNASPRIAADHYDNTGAVAADVRAGEDKHGIWVVGALRPHLSDEDIRAFRCAPLSGDWRRIAGKLELVGALSVNIPGFPVPRVKALVASGETETLFTFLEDDDDEFYSDYELALRQNKKASLAAVIDLHVGEDNNYSDYELDLRYGKKSSLASTVENAVKTNDSKKTEKAPAKIAEEEVPKALTKADYVAKAKNYNKVQILDDLKMLKELLDDPDAKMPKKTRDGLKEIYKGFTILIKGGNKFSVEGFDLDIITASGLEPEEWEAQLELSGLDVVEFYNTCHDEDGRFCEGNDGPGRARDKVSGKHVVKAGEKHVWHDVPPGTKHGPTHEGGGGPPKPGGPGPSGPGPGPGGGPSVSHKTYENFRQARQNALRWTAAASIAFTAIATPLAGVLQGIATTAGLAILGNPATLGAIFVVGSVYAVKNQIAARTHRIDYNHQVDKKIRWDKYQKAEAARRARILSGP